MNLIIDWIKKHWSSVIMAVFLSWATITMTYLTLRPNIKVGKGGIYNEGSSGVEPQFGANISKYWFGCATFKK